MLCIKSRPLSFMSVLLCGFLAEKNPRVSANKESCQDQLGCDLAFSSVSTGFVLFTAKFDEVMK